MRHHVRDSRILLAGACVVFGTVSVFGAQQRPSADHAEQARSSATPVTVTAGELADKPDMYYDRRVTVRAEVEQVFSENVFTLDEDRFFSTGRDVLVLMREPDAVPADGSRVAVTGTVRPFVRAQVERTYGWFTLDPVIWARFDKRPVIVADSVRTSRGAELLPADERRAHAAKPDGSTVATATTGTTGEPALTDLASVVSATIAGRAVGRMVDLAGVTVRSIPTSRSFWIASGANRTFVVVDAPTVQAATRGGAAIKEGATIALRGEIRQLPGASDQVTVTDWGLGRADAEKLKEEKTYIYASRVDVMKQ
jgi:hypothetical protein